MKPRSRNGIKDGNGILTDAERQGVIMACLRGGQGLTEDEIAEFIDAATTAKIQWNLWELAIHGELVVSRESGEVYWKRTQEAAP
jgi:hypothetical protein